MTELEWRKLEVARELALWPTEAEMPWLWAALFAFAVVGLLLTWRENRGIWP